MIDLPISAGGCRNETRIPEGHLIFLLGAGVSKDAGFPLVRGLTDQLRDRLPNVKWNGKKHSEFRELFDTIAHVDPDAEKNYERFFKWLRFLSLGNSPSFCKLARFKIDRRLLDSAKDLQFCVAKPIQEILCECHQKSSYEPNYLARLGDFVPKNGRLDVFSLNYDLCVEDACTDYGIDVVTGFCRDTGHWSPSLFRRSIPGINLYKVHGSLNWDLDDSREDQPVVEKYSSQSQNPQRCTPGSQMVLGPGSKLQTDDPFVTLYYEFHRRLRAAKICVTVGFSFQDEHMTKPLSDAKKRGLTVVDVRPDAVGDLNDVLIESSAKKAFENCKIWDAVQKLISDTN